LINTALLVFSATSLHPVAEPRRLFAEPGPVGLGEPVAF
jgi:hypothetical protein